MSDIVMPASFPETDFRAYGIAATNSFLPMMSEGNLFDPQERRRHFDWSWQAVRYRYRSCVECNDEFKALLANPSESWQNGWGDEELLYKLERCIYVFFTSALSIFDSFAFGLYFYGNASQPNGFPLISTPRKIDRKRTGATFQAAFPSASLTGLVVSLQSDPTLTTNDARFVAIDTVRNLVGHRISGRRSVRASGTTHEDGTHTSTHEDRWHLPGSSIALTFDEELLQRQLKNITDLLSVLSSAAREFVEQHQPPPAQP
jgi:hypothetical protein